MHLVGRSMRIAVVGAVIGGLGAHRVQLQFEDEFRYFADVDNGRDELRFEPCLSVDKRVQDFARRRLRTLRRSPAERAVSRPRSTG